MVGKRVSITVKRLDRSTFILEGTISKLQQGEGAYIALETTEGRRVIAGSAVKKLEVLP